MNHSCSKAVCAEKSGFSHRLVGLRVGNVYFSLEGVAKLGNKYTVTVTVTVNRLGWPGLRRTTGFGIPGPMTQDRSWNVTLGLVNQWLRGDYMASTTITQLTTARASTYFSAFSTLRRNHHWVCWLPSIRPVTFLSLPSARPSLLVGIGCSFSLSIRC